MLIQIYISLKATALLQEYWKDEQKDLKEEVRKTDEEMKVLLGEEDKEAHDNDMVEILTSKEEELRKPKEKKLQRDRQLQKERKRNPPGSKPNFAQIATMHIRKKLETTKARLKKADLQENSSDSEEENNRGQSNRRRGNQDKQGNKGKHPFRKRRQKRRKR